MNRVLVAVLSAAAFVMPAAAGATVLTFDTLAGNDAKIANGCGGLDWNNLYSFNPDIRSFTKGSGYVTGRKSGSIVAFNGFGDAATVLTGSTPFTLNDGYFTAAWNNGLTLTVQGFTGGSVAAFTRTVTLNVAGPSLVDFGWTGLTSVRFASNGGRQAPGLESYGTHLVLDDLRVNEAVTAAVPEPATWGMMILGFAAVGAALRRRARGSLARAA